MEKRVVITGIGVVTSVGTTVKSMWNALVAGRSGITYNTGLSEEDYKKVPVKIFGSAKDFDEKGNIIPFSPDAWFKIHKDLMPGNK